MNGNVGDMMALDDSDVEDIEDVLYYSSDEELYFDAAELPRPMEK